MDKSQLLLCGFLPKSMRIPYDDVKILITLVGLNRTIPSEIMYLFEENQYSSFSSQRGKSKHSNVDVVDVWMLEFHLHFCRWNRTVFFLPRWCDSIQTQFKWETFAQFWARILSKSDLNWTIFSELQWLHFFWKSYKKRIESVSSMNNYEWLRL